jgi:hypothetical protein
MIFYRYEFSLDDKLQCRTYSLTKETPKGYWIHPDYLYGEKERRWISKTSRKRYAYPSEPEALHAFICRKLREQEYINHQQRRSVLALQMARHKQQEDQKDV